MRRNQILLVIIILLMSSGISSAQWNFTGLPYKLPEKLKVPEFKKDTFSIETYGAVGDGSTMNSDAIEKAMVACSKNGGGVVLVPKGLWLTGPITLRSNINLHISEGALVLFSKNFDDYPMIMSYYEGWKTYRCQSPIGGRNLENIAITGSGIMDGSGDTWRQVKKNKLTSSQWKNLTKSGGITVDDYWFPTEKSRKGLDEWEKLLQNKNATKEDYEAIKDFLRPVMLSLIECKYVLLDGVTFQNSPSWCLHPLMCEHVTVRNVNVRNPWYAQNGDGIDLESCRIGVIENCTFDVGDDAICIKSGKNEEGRKRNKPTEMFHISNCTVYHGHGGFVIGSEMSGGVRDLYVTNCIFLGTDIGLRFKSNRERGGTVENIFISDISMIDIPTDAIRFNMFYGGGSPVPEKDETASAIDKNENLFPVNDATPQFKNIHMKNIFCNGAAKAVYFQGLPEMNINNITLENSSFTSKEGVLVYDGDNIRLTNVKLNIDKGPAIDINNSKLVTIKDLDIKESTGKLMQVKGSKSGDIEISLKNRKLTDSDIELSPEVKKDAVKK